MTLKGAFLLSGRRNMVKDFSHATLGAGGPEVFRPGLSASSRPGRAIIRRVFDLGINDFFGFGIDKQMTSALKELFRGRRRSCVLATGAYDLLLGHPDIPRRLEKRLRQFGTDTLTFFSFSE